MPRKEIEITFPKFGHKRISGLFKIALSPEQIRRFEDIGGKKEFQKGEQLVAAGSILDRVYILDQGSAEILVPDDHGDLESIRTITPGEMLGLTESLADAPYGFSFRLVTDCIFTEISREEFVGLLRKEPDICFELVSMMATAFNECFHTATDPPT